MEFCGSIKYLFEGYKCNAKTTDGDSIDGEGDCEDTSILAASMLKAMPENWNVSLVTMDSDNPASPEELNHVIVYVETGEYSTFIETTSSEEMNPYQEIEGFYEEVNPLIWPY